MANSKSQIAATSRSWESSHQLPASGFQLPAWLLANLAAVLLYAPWIPVAFRQATNPPVPPWRTAPDLWHTLRESWTALSLGQSAPSWLWPALLLTLGVYGLGLCGASANHRPIARWRSPQAYVALDLRPIVLRPSSVLPIATLGPLALILLVSLVTPLYHVRYLFTYSPAFYVVMAAGLAWLLRRSKVVFAVALGVWLAAAGVTLHAYWHDPAYRADDHRAAVRYVREHWRPGDVVLVNAGWPYTALTTYWDGPIATRSRLTGDLPATPDDPNALVMVTTGHVDGDPGLGWGDPRSDFFAMPADAAREQIAALYDRFERVWQYRIYDTVNDPAGQVRGWLAEDGQLTDDQVFAGEANLRVQGFVPRQTASAEPSWPSAAFGTDLSVHAGPLPDRITSGETLYPALDWEFTGQPVGAEGLRHVDPADRAGWNHLGAAARRAAVRAAVPRQPVDRRPGLSPNAQAVRAGGDAAGAITRRTGRLRPCHRAALARAGRRPGPDPERPAPGGSHRGPARSVAADAARAGDLRPAGADRGDIAGHRRSRRAARYRSSCCGRRPKRRASRSWSWCKLQDAAGHVVAGLEAQPLDGRYPTQNWAAGELVRDRHTLTLPADLAPGAYRLIVGRVSRGGSGAAGDEDGAVRQKRPLGGDDGGSEVAAHQTIQKERHLESTHL